MYQNKDTTFAPEIKQYLTQDPTTMKKLKTYEVSIWFEEDRINEQGETTTHCKDFHVCTIVEPSNKQSRDEAVRLLMFANQFGTFNRCMIGDSKNVYLHDITYDPARFAITNEEDIY